MQHFLQTLSSKLRVLKRRRGDVNNGDMSLKNKNYINQNILSSVNNILNSYDDKFVLSAIYEDILHPVIDEAITRKEDNLESSEQDFSSESPQVNDFIKRPVKPFKVRDKNFPKPTLIVNNNGHFTYQIPAKDTIVRQYNAVQTIPLRETRYGKRMKKGIERLYSSVPKWQYALQLVAMGIFALMIPAGIVQLGWIDVIIVHESIC